MKIPAIFICICIVLLSSCSPVRTVAKTPTSSPTVTPLPEVPRPTVDSKLSVQNNATTVFENGTWVVKNADGKVTATWDGATGTWTYNYDNITMQVGVAEQKYKMGRVDTISSTGVVDIPQDMMKPLPASEQDPHPLVPSGHYGETKATTQAGYAILENIGVDYRGIVFIDNKAVSMTDHSGTLPEYAVIFTVQNADHPDVINVIVVTLPDTKDENLWGDLTGSGKIVFGPTYADFIAMLKTKNPVGRRMAIQVFVKVVSKDTVFTNADDLALIDALDAGAPVPEGLDCQLAPGDISAPEDLFQ